MRPSQPTTIPVEYGKRFQGRSVAIEIKVRRPEAAYELGAGGNTWYTDRSYSRRLRFAGEFTTGSIEMGFPARDQDEIVDGPSVSFSPGSESAGFDLILKSVTTALRQVAEEYPPRDAVPGERLAALPDTVFYAAIGGWVA